MTSIDPSSEQHPGEPDEDSTEDVVGMLRRYDQELVRSGDIPPESTEDYLLGVTAPDDRDLVGEDARAEIERLELEEFTKLLRSTLNLVGLSDPSSVTPENIQEIPQELLEQLDPYNAESLFFEVARKVHKQLGPYEAVNWKRLLEQAQPENRDVVDLDNLQLAQRMEAFGYLIAVGIDPNEISEMVKSSAETGVASPSRRQNVNRMAYFFQEEPVLAGLVGALRKKAKRSEKYISASKAVRMGQIILRLRSERLEANKEKQASLPYDNERQWDSIDYDVYRKLQRRMKTSISIGNLIQAEMNISTVDELVDGI